MQQLYEGRARRSGPWDALDAASVCSKSANNAYVTDCHVTVFLTRAFPALPTVCQPSLSAQARLANKLDLRLLRSRATRPRDDVSPVQRSSHRYNSPHICGPAAPLMFSVSSGCVAELSCQRFSISWSVSYCHSNAQASDSRPSTTTTSRLVAMSSTTCQTHPLRRGKSPPSPNSETTDCTSTSKISAGGHQLSAPHLSGNFDRVSVNRSEARGIITSICDLHLVTCGSFGITDIADAYVLRCALVSLSTSSSTRDPVPLLWRKQHSHLDLQMTTIENLQSRPFTFQPDYQDNLFISIQGCIRARPTLFHTKCFELRDRWDSHGW